MPSKAATKPPRPRTSRAKPPEAPPARTVDGHEVVEVREVKSGLPGKDGSGLVLKMRELVLDDGTSRFDCADCDQIEDKRGLMMRHRVAAHTSKKPIGRPQKSPAAGLPDSVRSMTLDTLIALAVQADTTGELVSSLTEQALADRSRAIEAENALRRLKLALGRAGFALAEADA